MCVWRDSFVCVKCDVTTRLWYLGHIKVGLACVCVTWLIRTCGMWRDSDSKVTRKDYQSHRKCRSRIVCVCDVTHSYVWHATWLKYKGHQKSKSRICVCVTWPIRIYKRTHNSDPLVIRKDNLNERWGAGVETQKNVRGEDWGMGSSTI